jgi:hypothetical protein
MEGRTSSGRGTGTALAVLLHRPPGTYGDQPSEPAVHAAGVFRGVDAGHGRDVLYFARSSFTVQATGFSPTGLDQLRDAARAVHVPLPSVGRGWLLPRWAPRWRTRR